MLQRNWHSNDTPLLKKKSQPWRTAAVESDMNHLMACRDLKFKPGDRQLPWKLYTHSSQVTDSCHGNAFKPGDWQLPSGIWLAAALNHYVRVIWGFQMPHCSSLLSGPVITWPVGQLRRQGAGTPDCSHSTDLAKEVTSSAKAVYTVWPTSLCYIHTAEYMLAEWQATIELQLVLCKLYSIEYTGPVISYTASSTAYYLPSICGMFSGIRGPPKAPEDSL